jgi:hypothetical protein
MSEEDNDQYEPTLGTPEELGEYMDAVASDSQRLKKTVYPSDIGSDVEKIQVYHQKPVKKTTPAPGVTFSRRKYSQ